MLGVANKMLTVLANIVIWDEHATPAATRVREWPLPTHNREPYDPAPPPAT